MWQAEGNARSPAALREQLEAMIFTLLMAINIKPGIDAGSQKSYREGNGEKRSRRHQLNLLSEGQNLTSWSFVTVMTHSLPSAPSPSTARVSACKEFFNLIYKVNDPLCTGMSGVTSQSQSSDQLREMDMGHQSASHPACFHSWGSLGIDQTSLPCLFSSPWLKF